jgi:dolichol-phosphate mannosyltransferase
MRNDLVIFIPTYNEAGNIDVLLEQILALKLPADILIMDDNSSDGTGEDVEAIARSHPQVRLWRRDGKLGIGSAHITAIRHAQASGYKTIVTLDADFSHQPLDIPRFLAEADRYDVVLGSRYLRANSLEQWTIWRKLITQFGHYLTATLLRLPYDASGAFRLYRLDRIPPALFETIHGRDYEFFFESLTVLHVSGCRIGEIPIDLPARTYGHSKMEFEHMVRALIRLLRLSLKLATSRRAAGRIGQAPARPDAQEMRESWDQYWSDKGGDVGRSLYDKIASFYRDNLIKPSLNASIKTTFNPGAELIHAGCGGGQVDVDIVRYAKVTAVDISPVAISRYKSLHGDAAETVIADIFNLHALNRKFDGLYNLGVMEHFESAQLRQLLGEFNRTLRPGGRIVLFWPPVYGLSVIVLHVVHFVLNRIMKRNVQLHPPEPTKVSTRTHIAGLLNSAGFELERMSFGARDLFTYMVIVGRKSTEAPVAIMAKKAGRASPASDFRPEGLATGQAYHDRLREPDCSDHNQTTIFRWEKMSVFRRLR